MKEGTLKEIISVNATLILVAFCLMVMLQLLPSYFLFGFRSLPYMPYSPLFLIWIGIGAGIVSGFICSRSGRLALLECIVATALYYLVIFFIYGHRGDGFTYRVPLRVNATLFLLTFVLSIAGSLMGRITGLRRERKARALESE